MNETKMKEILLKLLNKTNDVIYKKLAVMAPQIRNDVNKVKEDLTAENNAEIVNLKETASDVEKCQQCLTDTCQDNKEKVKNLTDNNRKVHLESQRLNLT